VICSQSFGPPEQEAEIGWRIVPAPKSERRATGIAEGIMKNQPKIYLLTMNSPSHSAPRLWTGRSVHALRHCSVTQIGGALVEMQQSVDELQRDMGVLKAAKAQRAFVPAEGTRRP
jgi:hypothetical protein